MQDKTVEKYSKFIFGTVRGYTLEALPVLNSLTVIFQWFFLNLWLPLVLILSSKSPKRIFQNSYEWLLLEIKAYSCVSLMPRQGIHVCKPIQTDL